MAYVCIDLGKISDNDLINECEYRLSYESFANKLMNITKENSYTTQLESIANDIKLGKDITEKLRAYIYDSIGMIV